MKISNIKAIKSSCQTDLVTIDWNIGTYCNYNCEYCGSNTHDNINHLTYDTIINSINLLGSHFKDKSILLSFNGGEPTTNPNLFSACKSLSKVTNNLTNNKKNHLVITTNGTQSISYYNDILNYVDYITFSHHFQKNRPSDVFLNKLKEINISYKDKINVQVMCHGELFNEVKQAVEFYKKHNIAYTIRQIRPIKYDKTDPKINIPQPAVIYNDEYLDWMAQEIKKSKSSGPISHVIYDNNGTIIHKHIDTNYLLINNLNKFRNWICYAGVKSLLIYPNGDIYRCGNKVGGNFGNILSGVIKNLSTDPMMCTMNNCCCVADINTSKVINEKYLDLINNPPL